MFYSLVGVAFCIGTLYATACYSESDSLCKTDETVVFSCALKGGKKTLSLCSSPKLTKKDGYIQYRFGTEKKIELEYPANRQASQKSFRFAHYSRFQVDRTVISFDRSGYTYAIFDSYDGDSNPAVREQGVEVTSQKNKKKTTTLLCSAPAKSNLGSLISVVACDKTDALNIDGCK
jgi:hypothetical protein